MRDSKRAYTANFLEKVNWALKKYEKDVPKVQLVKDFPRVFLTMFAFIENSSTIQKGCIL